MLHFFLVIKVESKIVKDDDAVESKEDAPSKDMNALQKEKVPKKKRKLNAIEEAFSEKTNSKEKVQKVPR